MQEDSEKLDTIVSPILKAAVITSVTLISIGIIIVLVFQKGDGYSIQQICSYQNPSSLSSKNFPPSKIFSQLRSLDGIAFIALGLWVLIFTPVAVLFTSLINFLYSRDRLYIALSATVLTVLLTSIFFIGPYLH